MVSYMVGPFRISAEKKGEYNGITLYGEATVEFIRHDGTPTGDREVFPNLLAAERYARGDGFQSDLEPWQE